MSNIYKFKNEKGCYIMTRIGVLLLVLTLNSCKKLITIDAPVTSINEGNVYSNDATAISVLTGIYANMSFNSGIFCGTSGIALLSGLSADELTLYSGMTSQKHIHYYQNTLLSTPAESYGAEYWSPIYNLIFTCNAAIEGCTNSNSLTPSIKKQLLGESEFMRAFFYFYLVNLYGDVPLASSTNYSVNTSLARTAKTQVFQQIIEDLKNAKDDLSSDYLDGSLQIYTNSPERIRPTKWAAAALLARVYLFIGDYPNAEAEASTVLNNSSLFRLLSLNAVFLKNSSEAIWQLEPVRLGRNTEDARVFIIPPTGPSNADGTDGNPVYLSAELLSSFETGDQRKVNWVNNVTVGTTTYYYPYKYKVATLNAPITEYFMILRLAEQYLIRAEARTQLNNISGAQSDLNAIRSRAGLVNTTASDKASLLSAILHERQVELFTEWGHRWFDIKRTGNVDGIMQIVAPLKASTWNSYQQLYPILFSDILKNSNLTQNIGY